MESFIINIEKSNVINESSVTYAENNRDRIEIFIKVNNKKIFGYLNFDNSITINSGQRFTRKSQTNEVAQKILKEYKPKQKDLPLTGFPGQTFEMYAIDEEALLFNPYNDRIAMERTKYELNIDEDVFSEISQENIEKWIWNASVERNKTT